MAKSDKKQGDVSPADGLPGAARLPAEENFLHVACNPFGIRILWGGGHEAAPGEKVYRYDMDACTWTPLDNAGPAEPQATPPEPASGGGVPPSLGSIKDGQITGLSIWPHNQPEPGTGGGAQIIPPQTEVNP